VQSLYQCTSVTPPVLLAPLRAGFKPKSRHSVGYKILKSFIILLRAKTLKYHVPAYRPTGLHPDVGNKQTESSNTKQ